MVSVLPCSTALDGNTVLPVGGSACSRNWRPCGFAPLPEADLVGWRVRRGRAVGGHAAICRCPRLRGNS
jgi:hypothetical protein